MEFGISNSARSLRITSGEATSAALLSGLTSGLRDAEDELIYQWVLLPAGPEKPPTDRVPAPRQRFGLDDLIRAWPATDKDATKERRAQLAEVCYLGVVRIGAKAKSEQRARYLARNVRVVLASVRSPHSRFRRRLITEVQVRQRLEQASGPWLYGARLPISALSSLLAVPIGNPHVAGLPRTRTKHLPASGAIASSGRAIARSNFPGDERPLCISADDSRQHLVCLGATGTGKTTVWHRLIADDLAAGRGVVVIEKQGSTNPDSLFVRALNSVPVERMRDVIVLDVTDLEWPVPFNVFAQGKPQVVASRLRQLFGSIFGRSGVRFPESLYHGVMTLMTSSAAVEPMTFVDLMPLLVPRTPDQERFQEAMIHGVQRDEMLHAFWQRFKAQSRERREGFAEPLLDRIWELCSRPEVANVIGQSRNSFTMSEVLQSKKILLVSLAGLGEETADIMGALLLSSLWDAVLAGAADPSDPTMLFLDELHSLQHMPSVSPAEMLPQARKHGLALHLSTPDLGSLAPPLVNAILSNTATKVVFRVGHTDARVLAREFGPLVSENDFTQLGMYEVVVRLPGRDGVTAPTTGVTMPPPPPTGLGEAIREMSRERYGRPVDEVRVATAARRAAAANASARKQGGPPIGIQPWDR